MTHATFADADDEVAELRGSATAYSGSNCEEEEEREREHSVRDRGREREREREDNTRNIAVRPIAGTAIATTSTATGITPQRGGRGSRGRRRRSDTRLGYQRRSGGGGTTSSATARGSCSHVDVW